MTAYAVLARLAAGQVGDAFDAVRWLLLQRSSLGAYRSTQDTVVALQALAEYATVTHTSDIDLTVVVSDDGGGPLLTVEVDSSNLEVFQQEEIPCGLSFTVEATGSGNLIVQRSITYNVLEGEGEEAPGFLLTADWAPLEERALRRRRMEGSQAAGGGVQIEGTVCLQAADSSHTGMTMLVVRFFSGYTVTKDTLSSIAGHELVDKVEDKDGELQIYLADAPKEELCLTIKATQVFAVDGLAPAIIEAYDYYHPEVSGFKIITAAAAGLDDRANTTMGDVGAITTTNDGNSPGTTMHDGAAGSTTEASPASSSAGKMSGWLLVVMTMAGVVVAP